jgi:uncharacterized protein
MKEAAMVLDIKDELLGVTSELPLFDTHEHIERDAGGRYYGGDLFDILRNTFYLWADLVSSGMPPNPWPEEENDDEKKWKILRIWLPNVVASGYYRGIVRGLQAIHGMKENLLDDGNWRGLNESIRVAYRDPLWTSKTLRQKTHIRWAVNDVDGFNMDRSLFLPSIKFDYLLRGGSPSGREQIRQMDGVEIESFDHYMTFLERKLAEFKAKGAVALKTVTPYYRGLDYEEVSAGDARRAYSPKDEPAPTEKKVVEDFAFHEVIRNAIELDLPVQVHTGILAWNTTFLPHCNPTALNPLFLRYPKCRFVLFHGGYPFADELGILAKTFPNVYLDLCWMPWISQQLTRHYLSLWLELVPVNKFMWGGDAHRAECVHGHWLIAQEVVCEVLAEKVARGIVTPDSARQIAAGIFRNNARAFFSFHEP